MPNCDNCGMKTENQAHKSGIILCVDCAAGREPPIEKVIAELEAEGIDVEAFMRRIHATISKFSSNDPRDSCGN